MHLTANFMILSFYLEPFYGTYCYILSMRGCKTEYFNSSRLHISIKCLKNSQLVSDNEQSDVSSFSCLGTFIMSLRLRKG